MNSHLLISAIGPKGSGRETFMMFLAEVLYEEGLRCRYWNLLETLWPSEVMQRIVLVPRLDSEDAVNFARKQFPRNIIVRVQNSVVDTQDSHWIFDVKPDLFIRNDLSFRMFKFSTKILFNDYIKQSTKWKESINWL